ncbi:MAG: 23S rRNA (pseudouridine(1915)-N(3))-methyltransferase RlmH [Clostridia bacterium]|nr:23S rRNA (pseudouridine(1915)-N(3))-methyltransferase RlmH [Clostridia bacterium]
MVHINIICVGKLKEEYLKQAVSEYSKRLTKYCDLNIIEINDEQLPNRINETIIEQIKEKECKKIMEHIKNDSYVIPLDLKGKQFTSEELSTKIENIQTQGYSNITFIIGGTLGLTSEVLKKANESICFSKMTFPHQLIRVFLLEQIFRSFKISKNETYHW